MSIQKFEDVIAWQKSQSLALEIYRLFRTHKDYSFKNQICSSAVSISSNIAEGFERNSSSDFSRFLYISLGSCSELKSLIYLAEKLEYISGEQKNNIILQSNEISKIIKGLIKSMQTKSYKK